MGKSISFSNIVWTLMSLVLGSQILDGGIFMGFVVLVLIVGWIVIGHFLIFRVGKSPESISPFEIFAY